MDLLGVVFRHLDAWRHLPAYQLERRADIFFSVYLRGVVEEFTGVALEEEMIPELPIRCALVWPERGGDKSVKVDYALFAKDRSRVFFVELKTDGGSRRDTQDNYLAVAERIGLRAIVEGIRSIILKTNAHQKYNHLAAALSRLGYLELPPDLGEYLFPAVRPGLSAKLEGIRVTTKDTPISVIYVQPHSTGDDRCVDFQTFAAHVSRFDDPLSRKFSEHLLLWRDARRVLGRRHVRPARERLVRGVADAHPGLRPHGDHVARGRGCDDMRAHAIGTAVVLGEQRVRRIRREAVGALHPADQRDRAVTYCPPSHCARNARSASSDWRRPFDATQK